MNHSVFLAQLMGLYLTITGIALFVNRDYYRKVIKHYLKEESLAVFGAAFVLGVGLLLVLSHNIWSGWETIITLLAWLILLKGVIALLFPKQLARWAKGMLSNSIWTFAISINTILGLYLLYQGFLA